MDYEFPKGHLPSYSCITFSRNSHLANTTVLALLEEDALLVSIIYELYLMGWPHIPSTKIYPYQVRLP